MLHPSKLLDIIVVLVILSVAPSPSTSQIPRSATPILNVDVSLRSSDGGIYHTKTNFSGIFRFASVPSGTYTLEVSESALQAYLAAKSAVDNSGSSSSAYLKLDLAEALKVKSCGKPTRCQPIKVFPVMSSPTRIAIQQPKAGQLTGSIYACSVRKK